MAEISFAIYGSPTDKNVEEVEKGFKDALVDSKLNIVYPVIVITGLQK